MVSESWFNNAVGNLRPWAKKEGGKKEVIGVLAFEVSSLMSKIVYLWNSLSEREMFKLRGEILTIEGVRKLVSDDDDYLLGLACAEIMDNLFVLVRSVAQLGRKCTNTALLGFEHVFDDLVKDDLELIHWAFMPKKMEKKIKKMEKMISSTSNLYHELEVLSEVEQSLCRIRSSLDPNRGNLADHQQKVALRKQEVKFLREESLWNKSYDSVVLLLARSVATIFGRIRHVFGFQQPVLVQKTTNSRGTLNRSLSISAVAPCSEFSSEINWARFSSGPLGKTVARSEPLAGSKANVRQQFPMKRSQNNGNKFPPLPVKPSKPSSKLPSTKPFRACMVGAVDTLSIASDSEYNVPNGNVRRLNGDSVATKKMGVRHFSPSPDRKTKYVSIFSSKCKLLKAPPSTLGSAALALHYANVIILIEKMAHTPHLIGPDCRDELYRMLPTSIRSLLRARLKSYAKNLNSSMYDPDLAEEWGDALAKIIQWLSPLAHNMIRWQSERSFEQNNMASKTNVLLMQTLFFANQEKTEEAITELLVGLNYLWRFQKELNAKALLECMSIRSDDCCFDDKE